MLRRNILKNYYAKDINFVKDELGTDVDQGLKQASIEERLGVHGENKLVGGKQRTIFNMIVDQFKDFMIIILIIASGLSIYVGEVVDGSVILGIVLLNAILGVAQENKASNALKALKEMSSPKAKVIREGVLSSVDSTLLVPGDVVVLEAGDYVPADIRLVESINLKIDESTLTGESVPVQKDLEKLIEEEAPIADRTNSAFMSTIVTYGRGRGIVTGTGMSTEIGKIATMLNETKEVQTPLQKKIGNFGKLLGIICVVVCVIIFGLGLLRGQDLLEVFMTAISLAVAAIPEGLPAVVTVVLAMGMQRMIKRNAIVKKLSAVETLGSTTVICSDKTGTLTQNKMTVLKIYDGLDEWEVEGTGYKANGQIKNDKKDIGLLDKLLKIAVLCNDAQIKDEEVIGDPTEGALIVLGEKGNYNRGDLNNKYPRLKEFPFDSDRKLMSTLHLIDGEYNMFTKGAPDVILSRSTKILINGEVRDITEEDKVRLSGKNADYANNALRVLGYAYKIVSEKANLEEEESELVFAGLSCMIDPPREEAKEAIKLCKKAGIRAVMITGDHITTASAIAKEMGIIKEDSEAMEGAKINDYSEEEFKEIVKGVSVFARVSPEHKVKIVQAIRANGDVAAMTGDGVNDAPALKQADIGVAMGITGTDVSKEAADIILTDDNFASIVEAVKEGRIIYGNIRKFVGFLLSCNIGEILIIFTAMLLAWDVPLAPIQLLWVNLITDSFPAFALGLEEGEEGIMDQQPRRPEEALVDKKMQVAIIFQSIGLAVAALGSYQIGFMMSTGLSDADSLIVAKTFCFTTLILGELIRGYSARSEDKSLFKLKIFSNKFLNYSVLGSIVLLLIVVYVPFLQPIFKTAPLSAVQLLVATALSFIPLVAGEIAKLVKQ
jgi:Ca2+-transporting ATPase